MAQGIAATGGRELNTSNNEALCLEGIADHHLATGNTKLGIDHLGQALQIYQRLGMCADIERVTNRLAGLAQQQSNPAAGPENHRSAGR